MRLFLCEKPSQARDLAAVLGVVTTGPTGPDATYLETVEGRVTWASGHLLELQQPGEIDPRYRKWDAADLPIIPESIHYVPKDGSERQLDAIGDLLAQSDEVVLSTDAEREGELIGRNILNYHNYTGPLQRLWLKALDPLSIQHALDNLLPGDEKEPLYHSAVTRAKSDWLVGMNASRAATLSLGSRGVTMPVGRVQTPTLSLIVSRDQEIASFVPVPYSKLSITVLDSQGQQQKMDWQPPTPHPTQEQAQEAQQQAQATPLHIQTISEPVVTPPPPLFNLTGLQESACKAWGWSAYHTLSVLQRMYEHHKILSYPRSDSTVLPAEQAGQVPAVLANLASTPLSKHLPATPLVRDSVFVPDLGSAHHAIIPTTLPVDMSKLSVDEQRIYLLVAKSYVAAILPDYQANLVTHAVQAGPHVFSVSGEQPIVAGWKTLSTVKPPLVPALSEGPATLAGSSLSDEATKPPAPFTDGTLVRDMSNVGTATGSAGGLGTEATRANTIEGLLKSGMLERNGPKLTSTPKAQDLITQLRQAAPLLVGPTETAAWEAGLKGIEQRTGTPENFMAGITERVKSHVANLLGIEKKLRQPAEVTEGVAIPLNCPLSGLPVRDTPKAWVFPGKPEAYCPKEMSGRRMRPEEFATVLSGQSVGLLDGFYSRRKDKNFSSGLILSHDGKGFDFDFSPAPRGQPFAKDEPDVDLGI